MKIQKVVTEMMECAVYFEDLKPEAQQKLLDFYGVGAPEEMGFDERPLFELCD